MVKKMIQLVLTRVYSPVQAVDIANNEWGFRTMKRYRSGGTPLGKSTFYEMLHNVFYTGYFSYKGTIREGKHKPMISFDEFKTLQTVLSGGDSEK
jgi:hypothetical protein